MPLFSIIVVNYNTKDFTANCLDSVLAELQGDFEVIVVDNNSSDGSVAYLDQRFGKKIKIIANKENLGFGRANNTAAKIAGGEYLLFLNSDIIIRENIFPKLLSCFINLRVAVVAPQLVLLDGLVQDDAYGQFPSLISILFGKFFRKSNQVGVQWVSGAALAIRKGVFDEIGGFDEKYFLYFEDVDLCFKVAKSGYVIQVASEAHVVLLGGKSIGDKSIRKTFYYQAQNYFFYKHYGLFSVVLLKIFRAPYTFLKKYH